MLAEASPGGERVRAAEVIAALSLATDLAIGVPLQHGLHSTVIAMRLSKRLGIDAEMASQTYYACLLFYVGCTANADIAADLFGDHSTLTTYGAPGRFGSRAEVVAGLTDELGNLLAEGRGVLRDNDLPDPDSTNKVGGARTPRIARDGQAENAEQPRALRGGFCWSRDLTRVPYLTRIAPEQ